MRPDSYRRVEDFAQALAVLPADGDVLGLVSEFELTRDDFTYLDEQPGAISVYVDDKRVDYGVWHSRLRRVRNDPANDLFDRLSNG